MGKLGALTAWKSSRGHTLLLREFLHPSPIPVWSFVSVPGFPAEICFFGSGLLSNSATVVGGKALPRAEPLTRNPELLELWRPQSDPAFSLCESTSAVSSSILLVAFGGWARQASAPHVLCGVPSLFTLLFSFRMKKAGSDLPLRQFQGPLWCTRLTSQPCALSFWPPSASWLWRWQPR